MLNRKNCDRKSLLLIKPLNPPGVRLKEIKKITSGKLLIRLHISENDYLSDFERVFKVLNLDMNNIEECRLSIKIL